MAEEGEAEILIGTYEDYVIGYTIVDPTGSSTRKKQKLANGDQNGTKEYPRLLFDQSFAVRAHSGSVRCLASNSDGSLVFSAGFDEVINLFSLKKRKLIQNLENSINCAVFASNKHLICGSEDGNIYIYECKGSTFELVKTLMGHKMAITSLSAHPSGKVLLSISKDNNMRTWNLIKGRCSYVNNIKSQAHLVAWSRTGNEFMIAANNEVYLYNNLGILEHNIKLDKRINSIEFITDEIFIVATDSGKLELIDLKEGVSLVKYEAHEARIKSVKYLSESDSTVRFATASSDGTVKLWSTNRTGKMQPKELASVDTGARLICMTTAIHR